MIQSPIFYVFNLYSFDGFSSISMPMENIAKNKPKWQRTKNKAAIMAA